jgi:hypothetical protein
VLLLVYHKKVTHVIYGPTDNKGLPHIISEAGAADDKVQTVSEKILTATSPI